jgi:uncharacterized repeat protein (TIGR02543 family)
LLAAVAALLAAPIAHAEVGVEPVKVIITGSGSGQVHTLSGSRYRGSPEINCSYNGTSKSGVCETTMSNEGEGWEQVFLEALPAPGSIFLGWTVRNTEFEGCGTSPTCAPFVEPPETGSGEAEVVATFDRVEPRLKIEKNGEGTVIADPAGIVCGSICEAEFEAGKTVTLLASPAADWAFSAWSGCAEHVGRSCKVLMSRNPQVVKATFVATPLLTVEKAGYGYGRIAANGISCDESCSKSTAGVKVGTAVTVKATPAKGYEFAGFEGGTGNAGSCAATCAFTISEASSVKVKFSPIPSKALTVELTGPGAYKGRVSGKVVNSVYSPMISCGSGCTTATEWFLATGETELTAMTATGYSFKGWTVSGGSAGTCTGTTSSCRLATDADKTVEAKFE